MLPVEYVRSLNCNYERMLLEKKPEEKKYQYCILSRGGIKGLLSCGLRYINGSAYLYYDISSKQNVEQLYNNRSIGREWIKDFLWSVKQIQTELERFLLDVRNVIWLPGQVFFDLETHEYFFLFIPYYEGEPTFHKMMSFLLEHLDYEDEKLVECVYFMNEQLEQYGEDYLRNKIYEDAKALEDNEETEERAGTIVQPEITLGESLEVNTQSNRTVEHTDIMEEGGTESVGTVAEKRGLRSILEGRRQRNKKYREEYRDTMKQAMKGYAVAEETTYQVEIPQEDEPEEEYGRTIFIEENEQEGAKIFRLFSIDGKLLVSMEKADLSIGKKRDEVDLALEDSSVSRLHARIMVDQGEAYLEDLNSTNGTFKNGLRLRPYEKRRLDKGDEIKCGKVSMIFRY